MPASRSHDRTYIEPERHDELSTGTPATVQADAGHERRPGGQLAQGACTTPSKGGRARKGSTRLTHAIEALKVSDKLKSRARFMRRKTCSELAATVGAGHCGIIASLFVKLASEDIALREAALESSNVEIARKLGESARMHLMYAREVAAKDGESRARHAPPGSAFAQLEEAITGGKP